jgi:glycosyltransferase involved in cell wall biosynthesis
MSQSANGPNSPVVSVVIPCRNEGSNIALCLDSVVSQKIPAGGFEVLVIDGMSDDDTREILGKYIDRFPFIRLIDNPHQTTPFAMNAGIREARGKYIAIMGSHNWYAEDYLVQAVEVLEETGVDNVGGAMYCEGKGRIQRAIAAAFHSAFSTGGAKWHDTGYEGPSDTVFGGVYRREVFDNIGLFDEELARNQDDELNLRLLCSGGKIWQSPRIRSSYYPRNSIKMLFRQYRQYGYWKVRVIQKHRLPASIRHIVPGAFVVVQLVLASLAFGGGFLGGIFGFEVASLVAKGAAILWIGILFLYVSLMLVISVLIARRGGWGLFPVLPAVFAAYHFGYGLGFVEGVWDFMLLDRSPSQSRTGLSR